MMTAYQGELLTKFTQQGCGRQVRKCNRVDSMTRFEFVISFERASEMTTECIASSFDDDDDDVLLAVQYSGNPENCHGILGRNY
mmetsp:Transcript_33117/g.49026  ORF Transcript_33117/g.49026 Transcript_33117/m.49026 type:complete len:84 (-) Transcript_33117:733-984(-)